ncbi:Asp-tRNA(Asn)/Glu-tRNA(Gln) amidotransferase subunit GatB [Vallitalea okinawensis]|uniref:Asp-tRNA(Asn)/Glu-tRNA(Gln) amidotransferase subunit GatB n=1 Tax=Vallitalea okinawensis TaxID=2078660 RepID=UPI000CFA8B92|nr:Asp-tRNA(Asn)/Glu-tRNA(Gln) amidotransferase subunit GatB [Vallitalea okinawensis]
MFHPDYEIVIGLEVHSELKTESKIFCGCTTEFGGDPNTHCCPICTGMPGVLPVLNEKVVDYAIRAGLATDCKIAEFSKQDRKNYFYPDLPKAYQISQYDLPLCYEGKVEVEVDGEKKVIGLTRIHIEEDAGKLNHERNGSLVDYNRCGVPLIEIVSEPDMRSPQEARAFLEKLRSILLYADVSDCKMNEGSLRCDINLSVRKKGATEFGTRTEMKNLNSFNFAVKAMEYEAKRQIKVIEEGGVIVQETRRWDEAAGKSISMRSKEDAHDYRYFPDPDLMPIVIPRERVEEIRKSLPEMPDSRRIRYEKDFGLSSTDANILVASRKIADFFETATEHSGNPKLAANWIMTEIFRLLTEEEKEEGKIPFGPELLADLIKLIDEGTISSSIAKKVFEEMWNTGKEPAVIVEEKGLKQISDDSTLVTMAKEVIAENEKSVQDYLAGKDKAVGALVGQMMRRTKGQANPGKVNEILRNLLNEMK